MAHGEYPELTRVRDMESRCSEWVHVHTPFSGPHVARWVKPHEADGYWEGDVRFKFSNAPIENWQDKVLFWMEIPKLPATDQVRVNHGIYCPSCGGFYYGYPDREAAYRHLVELGWLQIDGDQWKCPYCLMNPPTMRKTPSEFSFKQIWERWQRREDYKMQNDPEIRLRPDIPVKTFEQAYQERMREFREKMEKGSQNHGVDTQSEGSSTKLPEEKG